MPLKYIVAGLIQVNPKFESAAGSTVSCEWPDWRVRTVTHLPPGEKGNKIKIRLILVKHSKI